MISTVNIWEYHYFFEKKRAIAHMKHINICIWWAEGIDIKIFWTEKSKGCVFW